jgi:hypothetical protein
MRVTNRKLQARRTRSVGAFIALSGLAIAFLGGGGMLGGMKHREQDLDTAGIFVLCGLGVALPGFIALVLASVRSRRKQ